MYLHVFALQIWDLSAIFQSIDAPPTAPPTAPHLTLYTTFNTLPSWVAPGLLATRMHDDRFSLNLELWDVSEHLSQTQRAQDETTRRIYRSKRTIPCSAPPTSLSAANGLIVAGESNGNVQLFDTTGKCLQTFSNHKGPVTDFYVVYYAYTSNWYQPLVILMSRNSPLINQLQRVGQSGNEHGCLEVQVHSLGWFAFHVGQCV